MGRISRRKFIESASMGVAGTLVGKKLNLFNIHSTRERLNLAEVRQVISDRLEALLDKGGPYGAYRKGLGQRTDLYSSCDVAITRTIWGENFFDTLSSGQRKEWVEYINSFANRRDGSYFDRLGHSKLHANGMVIGALGVLGGKQAHRVTLYNDFNTAEEVIPWLEDINWSRQWSASHNFWGGIHCYSMGKEVDQAWLDTVFQWMDNEIDKETGFWRQGTTYSDRHQALGGAVHIYPVYEHHQRTFLYPRQVIDSVLNMQLPNKRWLDRNRSDEKNYMGYLELDALYALKYMQSLAPDYRSGDIEKAVVEYGEKVIEYWHGMKDDILTRHPHSILAAVGTFGLLQQHLPDMFYDDVGWTDIFSDRRLYRTKQVEVLD